MSTWTWTYEKHSEAEAHYRDLLSQGCRAKMFLSYTGTGGWTITVDHW
jgi:hypothetical protein